MRISQLSEATGLPIATLKFYLRERVLHPGEVHAKTQASYDESHVDRVRFVRALTEVGGLSIAATRNVVEVMNDPARDRLSVLAAAHDALTPAPAQPRTEHPLAKDLLDELGWIWDPNDSVVDHLERQLEATFEAGMGLEEGRLSGLAAIAHEIAEADLRYVSPDPVEAVRHVVLGTALSDKLLISLRRLAQTDVAIRTLLPHPEDGSPEADQGPVQ